MRFSAISVAVTLALSVNAASLNKRDTSTCISDLTSVDGAVNNLTAYVNKVTTGTNDLSLSLSTYAYAQKVQFAVSASQTSCCSLTAPLSSADASSVLAKESSIASDFTTMSNAVVAKKSAYEAGSTYEYLANWGFGNLTQVTTPFLNCLTSVIPSGSQSTANGYATTIKNALQAVNDEFANVAIPDTVIYPDTQACFNDLGSLISELTTTNTQIRAFTNSSTASDFNSLQSIFTKDQSLSQGAVTSCCAINHGLDPPELTSLDTFISKINNLYAAINDWATYIKPSFDKISNADYLLKQDFLSLNSTTFQYLGCLDSSLSIRYTQFISDSFDEVNNAYASATQS